MKSRSRITCSRLARAMALVASMACGNAWAQCGPLGSAAEYPLYATSNLSLGKSTVSNGTGSFAVSGSGRAVNENTGVRLDPSPAPTLPALSPSSLLDVMSTSTRRSHSACSSETILPPTRYLRSSIQNMGGSLGFSKLAELS